jgi:tRNA pseudouridine55 synthase
MAWAGKQVQMPSREVEIQRVDILEYAYPKLVLKVACGSGTYIRSLANDLGTVLRCGAYLQGLRRTKVGEWKVDDAVKNMKEANWTDVRPLKEVLSSFPRRDLTEDDWQEISVGRNIEAEVEPDTIAWWEELPVAILVPAPDGTAHARKVF